MSTTIEKTLFAAADRHFCDLFERTKSNMDNK